MSVHWHPATFEAFRQEFDDGQCRVVLHGWTRSWALDNGWSILGCYSSWWFMRCIRADEQKFWAGYQAGAFDLHRTDGSGLPRPHPAPDL